MTHAEPLPSRSWMSAVIALAAASLAVVGSGCSASHADADTTTATVLRVVDGDTVDVVDDTRGRLRIRVLGIDSPEATRRATVLHAGVRRPASSLGPPSQGSGWPSSPIRPKTPTIATAECSPTSISQGDGTFRLRPRALERPAPTSTATTQRSAHLRSKPPKVKPAKPGADCGGHRATDTPSPSPSNRLSKSGIRAAATALS